MNITVTQHHLDVAGEAVERAHMRRGKAQRRATASMAQATQDAQDLQECTDVVQAAETEHARLTGLFHEQRKGERIEAEKSAGSIAGAGLERVLFDNKPADGAAAEAAS